MWTALSEHPASLTGLAWCHRRHDQADDMPSERVVAVKTYNVAAVRWPLGWELHIEGVGVTQSKSLVDAEETVRDYIALEYDIEDESSFAVVITPQLDEELASAVEAAREGVREFERVRSETKRRSRHAAHTLKARGLKGYDIAKILHVSDQRVSQLLKAEDAPVR